MNYFKLHPTKCEFEKDSETIIKVSKMEDGNYNVLIYLDENKYIESVYIAEDVLTNILKKYWVLIEFA